MDVREKLVEQAISHFWYGVSHDIFSEPVTTYAKLAIEALEKEKENGVTVQEWIPVTERFPDEHESLFARYKGTDKWKNAMFTTISDRVIVCTEYENGERIVTTANTIEGNWKVKDSFYPCRVTHWMPLPQPPEVRHVD